MSGIFLTGSLFDSHPERNVSKQGSGQECEPQVRISGKEGLGQESEPKVRILGAGCVKIGRMRRVLLYLWAFPTSLPGLLAAALTLATGGRVRRCRGVLEVWGGFSRWFLERTPVRARAMTLGHVVLGQVLDDLDECRDHELVHVRQAERWGPFFLPAYLLASLWAHLAGRHYYRDNPFEIDARQDPPLEMR